MRFLGACVAAALVGVALVAGVRRTNASDTATTAPLRIPNGVERVAIVLGSSWCPACRNDSLPGAIHRLMEQLRIRAEADGRSFATIGAAIDWQREPGIRWLDKVGTFDEITVGRSWVNSAAVRHIWRESQGIPALPQVVLIERTVKPDSNRVHVTEDRLLDRRHGLGEIQEWERAVRALNERKGETR